MGLEHVTFRTTHARSRRSNQLTQKISDDNMDIWNFSDLGYAFDFLIKFNIFFCGLSQDIEVGTLKDK